MKILAMVGTILMLAAASAYAQDTVKIGVITAFTGKYAPLGVGNRNGLLLAQEKINKEGGILGKRVELIIHDDEGEPAKSGPLAKKVITEDKVVAIIGSTAVVATHAIAAVTEAARIPHIYPNPAVSIWKGPRAEGRRFSFHTVPANALDAERVAEYLTHELKVKRVGIIYDANEYGTEGNAVLTATLKRIKGPSVVASEKYQAEDRDLTPVVTKIRNAGAEALVIWGTLPTPAVIVRNAKQIGWNVPVVGSTGLGSPKFIELAGEAANGVVFTSTLRYGRPLPEEAELFNLHIEKYKTPPSIFAGFAWDALFLLKAAMERAGTTTDPIKIRDALENLRGYKGVVGEYNFSPQNHNGLSTKAIVMIRIKEGKWTPEER